MSKVLNAHEAAVVGGGPAGCALAILLARAGRDVVLMEKTSAAHDKVCGEFISWEAGHYLRMLGIDLAQMGAQSVRRVRAYDGEALLDSGLPFPAWALSRRRLDAELLAKAREAGVSVHCGATVNKLERQNEAWILNAAQGSQWRAGNVYLASGKHEVSGWRRKHEKSDFIGFKMHLRLSPPEQLGLQESVEMHLFDAGYAGLELVEDGKANLCLLVRRQIYTDTCAKDWGALLVWLSSISSHLNRRLAGAEALLPRPLAVYGTPYGYLHRPGPGTPGLFRLGDQMAVIPSLAGDGIAIALHSAFLAAQTSLAGLDATAYHREALRAFRGPVRTAQAVTRLALFAPGRKAAFLLSRFMPALMTRTVQSTRLSGSEVLNGEMLPLGRNFCADARSKCKSLWAP